MNGLNLYNFPNHEGTLWLRNEVQAVTQQWLAGGQTTNCGHQTNRPCAVLWAPGAFTCHDCKLKLLDYAAEDEGCDRCHTIAALNTLAVDNVVLSLGFNLCADLELDGEWTP